MIFWKKNKDIAISLGKIDLSEEYKEILKSIDSIKLTEKDLDVLIHIKPIIETNIDKLMNSFYENLFKEQSLKDIIEKHSTLDRLKNTLKIHFIEMFSGVIDKKYVEKRKHVANAHVRIGLKMKWYIASFQFFINDVIDLLNEKEIKFEGKNNLVFREAILKALNKIINLEEQLVMHSYEQETERLQHLEVESQNREVILESIQKSTKELNVIVEESKSSYQFLKGESNEIISVTKQAYNDTQQTLKNSMNGKDSLDNQNETIKMIQNKMEVSENELKKLQDSIVIVDNTLELIHDVTDQINLLSLNAAIEASRAGEHGRTFSVVAAEIKKLSNKTRELSNNIELIMTNLKTQIVVLNESFNDIASEIKNAKSSVTVTNESFEKIDKDIHHIVSCFNTLSDKADSLQDILNIMNNSIEHTMIATENLNKLQEF